LLRGLRAIHLLALLPSSLCHFPPSLLLYPPTCCPHLSYFEIYLNLVTLFIAHLHMSLLNPTICFLESPRLENWVVPTPLSSSRLQWRFSILAARPDRSEHHAVSTSNRRVSYQFFYRESRTQLLIISLSDHNQFASLTTKIYTQILTTCKFLPAATEQIS